MMQKAVFFVVGLFSTALVATTDVTPFPAVIDESCDGLVAPRGWKGIAKTEQAAVDWLYGWAREANEDYGCSSAKCTKDLIKEAKDMGIQSCNSNDDDVDAADDTDGDEVERGMRRKIVCTAKAVRRMVKNENCWGYAKVLVAALETSEDFTSVVKSAWDNEKDLGHSWVEVTFPRERNGQTEMITVVVDVYNKIYARIKGSLELAVSCPPKIKCNEFFVERGCHEKCGSGKDFKVRFVSRNNKLRSVKRVRDENVPSPFGSGTLTRVPGFLKDATQFDITKLRRGSSLELQCCRGCEGCVAYIAIYRCASCSAGFDGNLAFKTRGLLQTGWQPGYCGPEFTCDTNTLFTQNTQIFRKSIKKGKTLILPAVDETMPYMSIWMKCETNDLSWCPAPHRGPTLGQCTNHCCPDPIDA